MSDISADEATMRRKLLELDVQLRKKQVFWETPRGLLLAIATAAAIAGVLGYKIGNAPQTVNVHLDQPLVVKGP
jgi:hypothetical protein